MTIVTDALWLAAKGRSKVAGGTERRASLCVCQQTDTKNINSLLTDRTSVSVMFQNVFQKWTSRFWVMRSNSVPLNSGSMAYFPEVKKELAATPEKSREKHI
uniref:Uncharacterized protein n=1 Tax=Neolamprologus brichardi TaxID=32507 RepID=A0A3Q4HS83_NEOBR